MPEVGNFESALLFKIWQAITGLLVTDGKSNFFNNILAETAAFRTVWMTILICSTCRCDMFHSGLLNYTWASMARVMPKEECVSYHK